MDKPIIIDDKSAHGAPSVHKLVGKMRDIHKNYGLWICSSGRANAFAMLERSGNNITCPVKPRYFEFYCIAHLFDGGGRYWSPADGEKIMKKGQCVIMVPRFLHFYGHYNGPFVEDTVCFTGPIADNLFKSGILKPGVFNMGKARRLIPLLDMVVDPAVDSQIAANLSLQNLLVELYMENKRSSPDDGEACLGMLVEELKNTPAKWWTVGEMSDFCNLSEPQFRRVFRRHTGMSPKSYIDRLKIQQSAEKLISSDESSVSAVAAGFGYLDPFHFSRRFKQLMGLSPAEYRARHSAFKGFGT
ncbi:MAG: hypothetical protein A2020_01170 [Lentisphaerae bacterium GWF2_45_14]|nr:MAG: hypothetical protein A2020_01170 [Lentisphaerae bacterium GWF2_45_14]